MRPQSFKEKTNLTKKLEKTDQKSSRQNISRQNIARQNISRQNIARQNIFRQWFRLPISETNFALSLCI